MQKPLTFCALLSIRVPQWKIYWASISRYSAFHSSEALPIPRLCLISSWSRLEKHQQFNINVFNFKSKTSCIQLHHIKSKSYNTLTLSRACRFLQCRLTKCTFPVTHFGKKYTTKLPAGKFMKGMLKHRAGQKPERNTEKIWHQTTK